VHLTQLLPSFAHRQDMVYGYLLKHEQVAFSPLTEDGLRFARAYVGRPDVLLYNDHVDRR
jgi:ESCO1/2 acetyl-transferase